MLLSLLSVASAAVLRWAVLVANNEGFADTRPLYFAEADAKKMKNILLSIGGVEEGDIRLLLAKNRFDLLRTLADVRGPIAEARARGDQTVLYFYYSGHADADQLQLGRSAVSWGELQELLERSGADVRIAFVDACQSGAMTKGGTLAPSFVFDVSERLDSAGTVILTSSTADEASQESNEVGGSYFTHFLASALTGGADEDFDGRVTLSEAYRYVYHETVLRTAATRGGAQHPSYDWQLSGTGDVVLTEMERAQATLVFPATNPGTFAVFDSERRMFVAEVEVFDQDRRLSLRTGEYLIQRRFPTHLAVAELRLPAGTTTLQDDAFRPLEYEDDVAKGAINATIRQAKLPKLALGFNIGGLGFSDETVKAAYFPDSPLIGLEARFLWRDARWASFDVQTGATGADLVVEGLPYTIPTQQLTATAGGALGVATRPARFRLGGGIRIEGIYLQRTFPGQSVADQRLFTVAPGLAGFVGWYPGRTTVHAQLRSHYLPYLLDDRDLGLGYSSLLLGFGYRF